MLQDPDLSTMRSPIHPHPATQYTRHTLLHLLRLDFNIIFIFLLVCIHLILQCKSHYRCATTCPQQREDGEITPPCLRSLTASPPTLHAGTLVYFL